MIPHGDSLPAHAPAPRSAPGDLDAPTFRQAGHALIDRIADFLDGLPHRPVTVDRSPREVRALLDTTDPLPAEGCDAVPLLDRTAEALFEGSLHNGHPRFLGYITSSASPVGMLGDLLASSVNPNVGAWILSPLASEIEAQTVRWIGELLGVPRESEGLLVSGGNMANMVGFWAARVAACGPEVRERGTAGREVAVYGSAETHTWIQKAADLSGIGTDAVRWIPTDGKARMRTDALAEALDRDRARGVTPIMVVGSAGTVSTGAVDDLPEIARICRERDVWFHVDGAYGGFAAMLPEAPTELRALALADSVAVDPHKWLYAPLEAGCALVRRPGALRAAFSYHPPYYHFGSEEEVTNFVDFGPQNSRGFRALKVWLALRQAGRRTYEESLREDCRLARVLHEAADAHPELEPLAHGLSITAFRYVPPALWSRRDEPGIGERLDQLNRALQARLERGGEVFLSNAVVDGRYALRGCIVNFRTRESDVRAIPEIVVREGRRLVETDGPFA